MTPPMPEYLPGVSCILLYLLRLHGIGISEAGPGFLYPGAVYASASQPSSGTLMTGITRWSKIWMHSPISAVMDVSILLIQALTSLA